MASAFLRPLLLSTVAGLSTSLGGAIAVTHQPSDASLAFLLGTAMGVMGTVSLLELWVRNALDNHPLWITAAVAAGAAVFCAVDPLLPSGHHDDAADVEEQQQLKDQERDGHAHSDAAAAGFRPGLLRSLSGALSTSKPAHRSSAAGAMVDELDGGVHLSGPSGSKLRAGSARGVRSPAKLLRLGLLMAATMTLHNIPEGFAVAFAAFTDVGPAMALAIAMHNIPEGIIVAAPIYAATGSRWRALATASASGLSEPAGALIALLLVKPFVTSLSQLDYLLAFVGGIMLAVCALELLPEARRCRHDVRMGQGVALGALIMLITLYHGV